MVASINPWRSRETPGGPATVATAGVHPPGPARARYRYHAFMSYSHLDRILAERLQIAIQQIARPHRTRIRNIDIFRDETNLRAAPRLWSAIEKGLDSAEFLIYLASPEAAQSPWVQKEIQHWLDQRGSAENILIVWLRGEPPWRQAPGQSTRTESLPDALRDHSAADSLTTERLYVDLSWAMSPEAELSEKNPAFLEAVARIAGTLVDKDPNQLIGEEVEQQRKRARVYRAVTAALAVLALGAATAGTIAAFQRREAVRQQVLATGRQLVAQAELLRTRPDQLESSTLLALEALKRFASLKVSSVEADQSLRDALRILPRSVFAMEHPRLTHVAYSAPRSLIVTAGGDSRIRVWDASGNQVRDLHHAAAINDLRPDPQGRYVVSAGDDGYARVWDLENGSERHAFRHDGKVTAAVFSSDAALIASSGWDGAVRLWHLDTGEPGPELVHREAGRPTDVRGVVFSADDAVVATFDPYAVRVWRTGSGQLLASIRQSDVSAIAFNPIAGHLAIASRDGTVTVREALTSRPVYTVRHTGPVTAVAFDHRGHRLATASEDHTVGIWSATTGALVTRVTHGGEVWAVTFHATGDYVASASSDRTGRVWELPSGREVARVGHANIVQAIAANGRRVITGDVDGIARVVELAGGDALRELRHGHPLQALAIGRDERYAALVAEDGAGVLWDLVGGGASPLNHGRARSVASVLDPAGKLVLSRWSGSVALWSSAGETPVASYSTFVSATAFHHDDRRRVLALGIDPGTVEVRFPDEARPPWQGAVGGRVESLAFSPEGRFLASAGADGVACIWNTATGDRVRCLEHTEPLTAVALGSEAKFAVIGDASGSLRLWNPGGSITVRHDGRVTALAVSPGGQHFAAGSEHGRVGVWSTGEPVQVATIAHDAPVSGVAFVAGGRYLVTAATDGSARLSWLQSDELARQACARLARNLAPAERTSYLGTASAPDTCESRTLGRSIDAGVDRPPR